MCALCKTMATFYKKLHHYHWQNKSLITAFLIIHFVLFTILLLRDYGRLQFLELALYDKLLTQQSSQLPADKRITLVLINDDDQRRYGWPVTDRQLLKALTHILAQKPQVIGLDIYRDLPVPAHSSAYQQLQQLFSQNAQIIAITKVISNKGIYVSPPQALIGSKRVGFNDLIVDNDGVIRRGLFFMSDEQQKLYWSFSLRLALRYLAQTGVYLTNHPQTSQDYLGTSPLPPPLTPHYGNYVEIDAKGYQYLLTYPGPLNQFDTVSFHSVISQQFPSDFFKDKIVILGTKAEATPDFFYIPVTLERISGAEIHAYATSQLLRLAAGQSITIKSLTAIQELVWIWSWAILSGLVGLWASSIWRFILATLSGMVLLLVISWWSFVYGWWLPWAAPTLSWLVILCVMIIYFYSQERYERSLLMNLFSRYVSKDIADLIWQSRKQYFQQGRLRPQRIISTVLFSDLQDFTTISENLDPNVLMEWLNEYMACMVSQVELHHGQVNKFMGDAIMAVFGTPLGEALPENEAQNARNAVNCALAMQEALMVLHQQWQKKAFPLIRIRVGIATGALVAGSLGNIHRQEYTVLGDTVNIAARLESFDKQFDKFNDCRILIDENTLAALDENYSVDYIGKASLKGRKELVPIYQVNQAHGIFIQQQTGKSSKLINL